MTETRIYSPVPESKERKSFAVFRDDGTFIGTFSMDAQEQSRQAEAYKPGGKHNGYVLEITAANGVLKFPDKMTSQITYEDLQSQLETRITPIEVTEEMFSLQALANQLREGAGR